MFKRLADAGAAVALTIDGKPAQARSGDTVAAALLAAGIDQLPHHAGDGCAAPAVLS